MDRNSRGAGFRLSVRNITNVKFVSPKINLTDVKFNHRTCTGRIKVRNNEPSTDSHSGTLHAHKDKQDANDTSAFVA